MAEYLWGLGLGIDRAFYLVIKGGGLNPQAGRMSGTSAYCFVLSGVALIVASLPRSFLFRVPVFSALGITILIVGCFNVTGHLAENPGKFSWWTEAGIAMTPAAAFTLFGLGLLAVAGSEGGFNWSLSPTIAVGFSLGVILMLFVTGIAFNYTVLLRDASERVSHTQEVLRNVENSRAELATLVGDQQRFLVSGDERLLIEQDHFLNEIRGSVRIISKLTDDNPSQRERVRELGPLVNSQLEFGADLIESRRRLGFDGLSHRIQGGTSSSIAERVDRILRDIGDEEFTLLGLREHHSDAIGKLTLVLLPLGVLVSLTILSVGLFVLNGSYNQWKQADTNARKLAAIVESSDDGMIGKDMNSVVTSWNKGAEVLFGYQADEMVGQSIMKLLPPDRQAEEVQILDKIRRGENVRHFETVRRRKDGTDIDVSVTVSPIRDPAGGLTGASKVVRDITERKKAEARILELNQSLEERVKERTAQLVSANSELEAFSYSVSHDLRAPLRAMDGFSQAVLEDFGEQLPGEGKRYLQIIRAGAQRMGALIDDLLTFSRLSRAPIDRQRLDMTKLVRDALDELGAKTGDPKVRIEVGPMPESMGDPALMKQVWLNLLSNALKYSRKREPSVIQIGCEPRQGRDVFFVKDNGTGFDMLYANKLFGVFQRLHRADEYEGTGVGLAIVQRVIHRHGGEVWADAAVDRGATFFFTLGRNTP